MFKYYAQKRPPKIMHKKDLQILCTKKTSKNYAQKDLQKLCTKRPPKNIKVKKNLCTTTIKSNLEKQRPTRTHYK